MKYFGYIYKTTNLVNGKIYVGQHKYSLGKLDEKYLGSGKLLLNAIKKYGKDNFKCEILEWCSTEKELEDKEIYYIKSLQSTTDFGNYNMSDGGFVPRFSGPRNYNYGRHWKISEEEREKRSRSLKGHPPTFTSHHSEKAKETLRVKTRENNLKRDRSIYKKVSETAKGNHMMNKDGVCIRVYEKDFQARLDDGWVFGGLTRRKCPYKKKYSVPRHSPTKGKVAVTDETITKFIPKQELNSCLENGWRIGMKKRTNQ